MKDYKFFRSVFTKETKLLAAALMSFLLLAALYYFHYLAYSVTFHYRSLAIYYYYFQYGSALPLSYGGMLSLFYGPLKFGIYQEASLYLVLTSFLIMVGNFLLFREIFVRASSGGGKCRVIGILGYLVVGITTIFMWLGLNDVGSWLPTNGSFAAFLPLYVYSILLSVFQEENRKRFLGYIMLSSFFLAYSFNSDRLFLIFDVVSAFVLVLPFIKRMKELIKLIGGIVLSTVFFVLSDPLFSLVFSFFNAGSPVQPLVHPFNLDYFGGGIDSVTSWVYSVTGLLIPWFEYLSNNTGKVLLIVISFGILAGLYVIYRLLGSNVQSVLKKLWIILVILIFLDLRLPGTNYSILTYVMLRIMIFSLLNFHAANMQTFFTFIDANRPQRILYEYTLAFLILSSLRALLESVHKSSRPIEIRSKERKDRKAVFTSSTATKVKRTGLALILAVLLLMVAFSGVSWVQFAHQNYLIDETTNDPYAMSLIANEPISQYSQIFYTPNNDYYYPAYAFSQSSNPVSNDYPFFKNFDAIVNTSYFQGIFKSMPAGTFIYPSSSGFHFSGSVALSPGYSFITNFNHSNTNPSLPVFFVGSMQDFDQFYSKLASRNLTIPYAPEFYDSLYYNDSQFINILQNSEYIVFGNGYNISDVYFSNLVWNQNTAKIAPSAFTTEPKGIGWYQRYVTNTPQGSYFRGYIPLSYLPIQTGYLEPYGYIFSVTPNSTIDIPIPSGTSQTHIAVNCLFSPGGGEINVIFGNENFTISTFSNISYYGWVTLPFQDAGKQLKFVNLKGMQSINLVMEYNEEQLTVAKGIINNIIKNESLFSLSNFTVYAHSIKYANFLSPPANDVEVYNNFSISNEKNLILMRTSSILDSFSILLVLPSLRVNYQYVVDASTATGQPVKAYLSPVWGNFMGTLIRGVHPGTPILIKIYIPSLQFYWAGLMYVVLLASILIVAGVNVRKIKNWIRT